MFPSIVFYYLICQAGEKIRAQSPIEEKKKQADEIVRRSAQGLAACLTPFQSGQTVDWPNCLQTLDLQEISQKH